MRGELVTAVVFVLCSLGCSCFFLGGGGGGGLRGKVFLF